MCLSLPGRVISVDDDDGLRMGTVELAGLARRICLAYVPEAGPGSYVVVHAGFAVSCVEADAAAAMLAALGELADAEKGSG
jgi:hydrogenase expression/formation protein HypC